jgi:hypothetical protein
MRSTPRPRLFRPTLLLTGAALLGACVEAFAVAPTGGLVLGTWGGIRRTVP